MNKPDIDESLSALVDDALGRPETDRLLERLRHDRQARQRIDRYAVIGMAMRGEAPAMPRRDFAVEIMQRIQAESAEPASRAAAWRLDLGWLWQGWRMPAFGVALAATVAGVAVLVVQPSQHGPDAAFVALTPPAPPAIAQVAAPEGEPMPDPYLIQHLTHAEGGPMTAMSSNVRLVAYERP